MNIRGFYYFPVVVFCLALFVWMKEAGAIWKSLFLLVGVGYLAMTILTMFNFI